MVVEQASQHGIYELYMWRAYLYYGTTFYHPLLSIHYSQGKKILCFLCLLRLESVICDSGSINFKIKKNKYFLKKEKCFFSIFL